MSETIVMESCGTQHPTVMQELYNDYVALYEAVKKVFPDKKLSRFFPMQGEYYNEFSQVATLDIDEDDSMTTEEWTRKYMEPAVRLMVVGRSVNGWTELKETSAEQFAQNAVDAMLHRGFDWLRDDGQGTETYFDINNVGKRYNINKSAFFRCIRRVLNGMKPITSIQDRWFEHMLWSNLYTIAPPDTGNAEGKLQDIQVQISKRLLLQQIQRFAPTHILFITDWDHWFDRFADAFPEVKRIGDSVLDNVVGAGTYGSAKVIVTVRPDRTRPNKPDEVQFAADVLKHARNY